MSLRRLTGRIIKPKRSAQSKIRLTAELEIKSASGGYSNRLKTVESRIGPHFYYRAKNGREVAVIPLTCGRARIIIGPEGAETYEEGY